MPEEDGKKAHGIIHYERKNNNEVSLAAFLSLVFLGCGGGEEAVAPADVDATVAAKPEIKGKKQWSAIGILGFRTSGASAYDRIDSALDSGNFMGAVNVAIKSG